jgi:hypothetical protein
MKNLLLVKSIQLIFCACIITNSVFATNYFVSSLLGKSGNNGLSVTTPKLTIQSVVNLTHPGDTVLVMDGIYKSTSGQVLNLLPANSGSSEKYITYKAYLGHQPKITASGNVWNAIQINASYIILDGLELEGNNANITYDAAYASYQDNINGGTDWARYANYNTNGISIGGPAKESKLPHHVVIRNCKVHDFPGGGISSIQADYTTIENNLVYNNAWYMMYAGSGISILNPYDSDEVTTYRNIVRNNFCHTNKTTIPWVSGQRLSDGNGIIIDVNQTAYTGGPTEGQLLYKGRTLVENNVSINNGGSGIHSYLANHVDIVNNTACNNGTVVGYPDIFTNNCNDVNIINNIMYSRKAGKCNSSPMHNTEIYDYNIYFNGTVAKKGAHDLLADPQFVNLNLDLLLGDFRLKKSSPAVDSGSSTLKTEKDIEGRNRPLGAAIDRGAYEFDPATSAAALHLPGSSFHVFPNPAINWISIVNQTDDQIKRVEIYSLQGKLEHSSGKATGINISSLASGMYILRIYSDLKDEELKIIKL